MYPAQQLANDDYSENDLPDAVTVDGVSFNRSGTGYGNTSNGVILEGNVWAKYRNGARSARPCLIQGGVVDQFADTYTVTITGPIPTEIASLNRVSLCLWEGIGPSSGSIWSIRYFYEDQEPNFLYRWLLDANGALRFKQGPSNTPAGNYDTEYVEELLVVVS